jgi:putative PIN family toxin of toxin-antitoxin system
VVDANVWLDLYYFHDFESLPLASALQSPRWAAVRCRETDAELRAVLRRPRFCSSPGESGRMREHLRAWQARARLVALRPQSACSCRDPDDQKYLDLALTAGAAVLLTKDKALLALSRRTRRLGLEILTPRQFGSRFA